MGYGQGGLLVRRQSLQSQITANTSKVQMGMHGVVSKACVLAMSLVLMPGYVDFPHEHARSRAFRWGEDGIAGVSDSHGLLNIGFSFWNEKDDFLKERLFGLSNPQGNHGESVKECYFHVSRSFMSASGKCKVICVKLYLRCHGWLVAVLGLDTDG